MVDKSGVFVGGDKRDRTADLLNAIQALSQLSYTPMSKRILTEYSAIVKHYFPIFISFTRRNK